MRKLTISAFLYLILSALFITACKQDAQFTSLSPSHTGIHFSNRITESDTINILTNEYIYNGGGIGIADFNRDGLNDAFFTANMSPDRLYLNEGNLTFKDITKEAGIDDQERWASGVAIVDINADEWPDIYICTTNRPSLHQRTNMLWVNQGLDDSGVPQFKEMAADYGLADTSHSTMAAFFDYDNDGDLDMYLAINEMDEEKLPNKYRFKIVDGTSQRTDKLFRNDWNDSLGHASFTDVSKEAGILIEGFSLGLNIVDINQDGWKDIFITNDYVTNDLLYINQKDGTFINEAAKYFRHTSHSAMGNDVVDINNDGLVDIVAVDMMPEDNFRRKTMLVANNYTAYYNNDRFKYEYQYTRNTLQLNGGKQPGDSTYIFGDIAMMSGISATDWSWTPLVADFNNDGFRDMIITNGFPKDVTDRDFMDYHSEMHRYASLEFLLKAIPSVKLRNYAYRNTGNLQFEHVSDEWGINHTSFSNGAAYVDLDNDGDLDYLVNNINDSAFVYKNLSIEQHPELSNWLKVRVKGSKYDTQGLHANIEIFYGDEKQFWENTPYRGYLSSVQTGAHFGLGKVTKVDKVVVTYGNNERQKIFSDVSANQVLEVDMQKSEELFDIPESPASPTLFTEITHPSLQFMHEEMDFNDFNIQPLLPHKLSQYGPGMAVADVNQDKLWDFYVGGDHFRKGTFFIQQEDGTFSQQDLLPGETKGEQKEEELGILFFDADGDNDEDLYLVSGGYEEDVSSPFYQDRLFINENGTFTLAENALPSMPLSGSCVRATDFDKDGDLDVFVGGRVLPGKYPTPVSSYLLRNDSDSQGAKFSISDAAPILNEIGMVCDALWTDFDNDGWMDLMIGGEWMPITFLRNVNGTFEKHEDPSLNGTEGWWNSLSAADFDRDGDIDYIGGNLGLNTLNRVEDGKVVGIYAADFDENGGLDAIPTATFKDIKGEYQEFPFLGRSDITKQLIAVKGQYLKHADFAKAPMQEIVSKQTNQDVIRYQARELRSSYIENLGNGSFAIHPLPIEAQVAPIYGIISHDVDQDYKTDVVLIGNDYGNEVSMGRYDAFHGLVLKGDGKGGFTTLSTPESGFYIPGDAKSMIMFPNHKGDMQIVASQNRGPLKSFIVPSSSYTSSSISSEDMSAIVRLNDSVSYKVEFYYGSGYLSQSPRLLFAPKEANKDVSNN